MKKIVALVLSLVMVLGLATTAFAANVPQWDIGKGTTLGFDVFDGNNVKVNGTEAPVAVKFTAAVVPTVANGYMGNIAFYKVVLGDNGNLDLTDLTGTVTADTCFVLVPAYEKGCIAIKAHDPKLEQGKVYTDAASQSVPGAVYFLKPVVAVHYNWTLEKYDDFGTMCKDVIAPSFLKDATEEQVIVRHTAVFGEKDPVFPNKAWDNLVLLDAGYEAGASTYNNVLVDGVIYTAVALEAVDYVDHSWVASEFDAKGVATKYTCSICKTVGTVVTSPFLAPADAEIEQLDNLTYVYFYFGKTAAGDKVESAQTFDAGIAMYVGMSVMAAAGSAVVLKKKD